jgi:hypothetical protein
VHGRIGNVDAVCMKLTSLSPQTHAIVAYRCGQVTGYAFRTSDGSALSGSAWNCTGHVGLHSQRCRARTAGDARLWLKNTCTANQFEYFSDLSDLSSIHGINGDELPQVARMRLGTTPMLKFNLA